MKRPAGVTILATALACLAAVGFVNGALEFFVDRSVISFAFAAVAFLYGITALVSSVALWRMRRWAHGAFLLWGVVVVLTLLYYQVGLFRLAWLEFAVVGLLVLILLGVLERYVRTAVLQRAQGQAE